VRPRDLVPYRWRQGLKRRLFAVQDMEARLGNLRRAGFTPSGAIDGGAYRGEWTRQLWRIWPHCPVLLVEPQPTERERLQRLARRVRGCGLVTAALSHRQGSAAFRLAGSGSGMADDPAEPGCIVVEATTLAALLAARPTFSPNLLKLDLQGHELAALRGAGDALPRFEVIVLEVSLLRIGNVPIFHEVDAFLQAHGFQLYDLVPQHYRPLDGALWQIDAFYVRRDSPLVASRAWA
jgi:FkbM family methyltransferase